MIYKSFQDIKLSALGMGCMRLPCVDKNSNIDLPAVKQMIAYAMEKGVNYYDTAWGYHDGKSEPVMGEVLSEYPRESFYLATKFPGYDLNNFGKAEEIFEQQLKRCRVEYFDFYLFHNVCEMNIEHYLNTDYKTADFLVEQKKNGRIRHLGFSIHGNIETTRRFLDAYGEHIEFCQIQLNWLDYDFQSAKEKIELLRERNIPIWVMEPLRGGKLCNLSSEYEERLKALRPDHSVPEWAFRFLQSFPDVIVTLSGMSNFEQLKQNIATFEDDKPLNDAEIGELFAIARDMTSKSALPCTKCRYCTTYCPMELDIPWMIELYNDHVYSDGGFVPKMAFRSLDDSKKPSACIGCRACEAVCPQQIKISEMMSDFTERMR